MKLDYFFIYMMTMFVAALIPGPSVLLGLNHGMRFGLRKTLATCAGVTTAAFCMALVSVLGLGVILSASGFFFTAIRYAGAVYLIYLGVKTFRTSAVSEQSDGRKLPHTSGNFKTLYCEALMVAFSNPKAITFYAAVFPQFIHLDDPLIPQYCIMLTSMIGIVFTSMFIYNVFGAMLGPLLWKPVMQSYVNRITGSLFVFLGIGIGYSNR